VSLTPLHPGEKAAQDARRDLGIPLTEPLRDLLDVVEERLKLPVFIDRFGQADVAGVLLKRGDGDHFIAVNADREFGSPRQRFTLAHEVGHVRMGHQPRVDMAKDLFNGGRDEQEVAANYFAAEFVAPRQAVVAWLEERDLVSEAESPETIAKLGLSFGLSFKATCYRFQRADVVSQAAAERLVEETGGRAGELARLHCAYRLMDSIEALWRRNIYPRPPRETIQLAAAARDAGLLDDDEYAEIVPSPPDDDYPFSDWAS
jgi:Zn-dependent peptidase ImmA (M78 family)